jgi:hypothetical protein
MTNVAYFTGKVNLDNSFSIGYVPPRKKGVQDARYDRDYSEQFNSYTIERNEYGRTVRKEVVFFEPGTYERRFIKSSKSSQKPSKRYGEKGITTHGRKTVKNATILLERTYGVKNLGFATATLPPMPDCQLRHLIDNWSDVQRKFYQEIKRECERRGNKFVYVGVVEIQEKRARKTGQYYPHLHFVYWCRKSKKSEFFISAKTMRAIWKRVVKVTLLRRFLPSMIDDLNFNASIDTQIIKKSAAAYLGKYLSKGSGVLKEMREAGYPNAPNTWWSITKNLRECIHANIITIRNHTSKAIFYDIDSWLQNQLVSYFKRVNIDLGGHEFCVGISGTLTQKGLEMLKLINKA